MKKKEDIGNKVKNGFFWLLDVFAHETAREGIETAKEGGKPSKKGPATTIGTATFKAVEGKLFGLGKNEEWNTGGASIIAEKCLNVTLEKCKEVEGAIVKICNTPSLRNSLSDWIGLKDSPLCDEWKEIMKMERGNVQGAYFIERMSKLSEKEIRIYLKFNGVLDTPADRATSFIKTFKAGAVTIIGRKNIKKLKEFDASLKDSADAEKIKFLRRKNLRLAKKRRVA